MARYKSLPNNLRSKIELIDPVEVYGVSCYPCSVINKKKEYIECVYIVEEKDYFCNWGVWPEEDSGKLFILINDVIDIFESSKRLPTNFAKKIYAAGESGMGYHRFVVKFSSGISQTYIAGGVVDFIEYPIKTSDNDIIDVYPNSWVTGQQEIMTPKYYWCLYSDASQKCS